MSDELKPCPWCGITDSIKPLDLIDEFADEDESQIIVMYCSCCGAQGPHSFDKEEAIEAWNKRK